MIIIDDVIQGTDEWHDLRLGVFTASKSYLLFTEPTKKADREAGKFSDGLNSYVFELLAEIVIKQRKDSFTSKAMEHGLEYEDEARKTYQLIKNINVHEVGIVYKDDMKIFGCSPDGLVKNEDGEFYKGIEIKCPNTDNHLKYFFNRDLLDFEKKYYAQVQYSMYITGFDEWDFISYDPRMDKNNIIITTIKRDEEYMAIIEKKLQSVSDFIFDRLKELDM